MNKNSNRDATIDLITRYLNALKSGDFSEHLFVPDVTLFTPFMETPLTGMEAVIASLKETAKVIEDINILRLVVEDEFACAIIEFKHKNGITVEKRDTYRISDGKFAELRPYFDPCPLTG